MRWDLYDKNYNITDMSIDSTETIPNDLYHLTVNVWIVNSNKQVLLLKKAINYGLRYPGCWTGINGNVLESNTSLDTIPLVINDKLNIDIEISNIKEVGIDLRNPHNYIYNTFIVESDIDINDIHLDEEKYTKCKYIDYDELVNMINNGEIEYPLIERIEKYLLPELKN